MKKIIILLFFILIPLVLSETKISGKLDINDSITVYGKTLTILSANNDRIRVDVDGVENIVKQTFNKTTNINEMFIEMLNFTYIDWENIEAILKITVNTECGDDNCSISETSTSCCSDCGCEGNLKCINNICQKEECVINADCDDNKPSTLDTCSSTPPRTCSNELIVICTNNDSYCPTNCTIENDNDCIEIEEIEEEIIEEIEEEIIEEPKIEETIEKSEEDIDPKTKEKKGFLIMGGTALVVIIIGLFIFIKRR